MSDDLISRQAAIDAIADCTVYGNADDLKEAVMQENAWNKWSGGVLEALEAVEELPSAQPERKKGCKIVKSTGRYGYCACDQCGKPVHPEDLFCSKCGADFREEDT